MARESLRKNAVVRWYVQKTKIGSASIIDEKGGKIGRSVWIPLAVLQNDQADAGECAFGSDGRMPQEGDRVWVEFEWVTQAGEGNATTVLRWGFRDPVIPARFRMLEYDLSHGSVVGVPRETFDGTLKDLLRLHPRRASDIIPMEFGEVTRTRIFQKYDRKAEHWIGCEDPRPPLSYQ